MSNSILRYAAIALASFVVLSTSAMAQSTILVVDTAKVIRDSSVGKYAESQLNAIGKSMESELKAQTSPLESKSRTLKTALEGKKTMAEVNQTLQARPDLQQAMKDVQAGQVKVAQESKIKNVEFSVTERKAFAAIATKVKEIIDQVAVERGADLVMDKSTVVYNSSAVDITQTVLSRLNSQMTTVSITRERLPRQ